jgi:pimeloyl-ACP methyl ester carboxylesterase
VRRVCASTVTCLALLLSGWTAHAACPAGSSVREWLQAGPLCLAAATYGADTAGSAPALVVVLHGDTSAGGPADYHYDFAHSLAKPGLVAVALLRPGYSDRGGRASEGQDFGRRDHYTAEYIGAVGTAVEILKKEYGAARVVLVGHSGGAAYAGVLIGSKPGIAYGAVLVSCPCDVKRWREQRGGGVWTRSLSPSNFSAKVPATMRIVAVTGANDDNTPPQLAQDYVAGLAKRGVKASFVSVAGAGHNFNRATQEAAAAALKEMLP